MVAVRKTDPKLAIGSVDAPTSVSEISGSLKNFNTEQIRQTSSDTALNDTQGRTYQNMPVTQTVTLEFAPTSQNYDFLTSWYDRADVRLNFEWEPRGDDGVARIYTGVMKLRQTNFANFNTTAPSLTATVELQNQSSRLQGQPLIITKSLPATIDVANPATSVRPKRVEFDLNDYVEVLPTASNLTFSLADRHPLNSVFASPCTEVSLEGSTLTVEAVGTKNPVGDLPAYPLNIQVTAEFAGLVTTAQIASSAADGSVQLPTVVDHTPAATGYHSFWLITGVPSSESNYWVTGVRFARFIYPGFSYDMYYHDNFPTYARWTSGLGDDGSTFIGRQRVASRDAGSLVLATDLRLEFYYTTDVVQSFAPFERVWPARILTDPDDSTEVEGGGQQSGVLPSSSGSFRYWALSDGVSADIYEMPVTFSGDSAGHLHRDMFRLDENGDRTQELTRVAWRDGSVRQLRLTYLGASKVNACDLEIYSGYIADGGGVVQPSLARFGPDFDVTPPDDYDVGYTVWAFPSDDNNLGSP